MAAGARRRGGPDAHRSCRRPARCPTPPEEVLTELSPEVTSALTELARGRGWTVNTLVQAAWGILLGKLTGSDDVVFGATVSGRPPELPGVENMVGLFINTLPVRVRLNPAESLSSLLNRAQEQASRLVEHHHLGLTDIHRLAGHPQLFDTLVLFENYPLGPEALRSPTNGLRVAGVRGHDATHYPLCLVATQQQSRSLRLRLDYRPDAFDRSTVASLARRLERLLAAMGADPDRPLAAIDLLTVAERRQLAAPNTTEAALPPSTVAELLATRAARTPDAHALMAGGTALTYAQLHARANRLARVLIERGAGPERVVALSLPRSADMVVALLAVMKTGRPIFRSIRTSPLSGPASCSTTRPPSPSSPPRRGRRSCRVPGPRCRVSYWTPRIPRRPCGTARTPTSPTPSGRPRPTR
ncbi:hypothetical protein SVIO_087990 [Streptomyces violaceusniger]|uniref:Condensation domain-containing protein n=1 Tax=Streptomyces violaceusniger TaxID=68280 RepID=A0A4D4LFZ5_STRVO|nr:hypothetical protein SVIO_087990 [Streptomyces violaceusniger]